MNIIPFEGSKLPAHLAKANIAALNDDLTSHAGAGFPVLSLKGKTWAVVRDKERTILPNPKDPDSAATSVEVVLLRASKATSKVWYANGYDPKAEAGKPDCYSTDGKFPASDCENPQAKSCAACKHNDWGSKINDKGVATKGKACQDSVRVAVAPNGQLNDPHLLRIPPSSIRNLGEYGNYLTKRGVAYNMVVTKIGFDPEAESPKLTFKPMGFLGEAEYAEVLETMESSVIDSILGIRPSAPASEDEESAPASKAKPAPKAELEEEAPKPKAKPAPKAEPEDEDKPAPKAEKVKAEPVEDAPKPKAKAAAPKVPVVDEDPDLDLDGIDFDD